MMGSYWRVGTGSQISISSNTWILDNVNYKLVVDVPSLHDAKVSDLIDNTSKVWKKDLITNTFSPVDARRILSIPLAEAAHDDFRVWGGEGSGDFFVRSTYKLLQINSFDPTAYALHTESKDFYNNL